MQRLALVTLLIASVMCFVAGAMLPLANLMRHLTVFAGLLAVLMGPFAAVVLCFTATVPIVLTFLVFQLALSVLAVPEMFPVVLWRRRFAGRWRRGRFPVVWRRRSRLCAGFHSGPQPQN